MRASMAIWRPSRSSQVQDYERQMLVYLRNSSADILAAIRDSGALSDESEAALKEALAKFRYQAAGAAQS